jgi:hypothetical protein
MMRAARRNPALVGALLAVVIRAAAQQPAEERLQRPQPSNPLIESGRVERAGELVPYVIHRLPISSFPELPENVVRELEQMGCMIPQTYEAHHPENVVHASLERAGSSDWAVLCSSRGTVSLLVFFGSDPGKHMQLRSYPETQRLQAHDPSGLLGFNWAIDPASPEIVHQAQIGLSPRPPRPDHDALADSVIDHRTIYHFYAGGKWTVVDLPA